MKTKLIAGLFTALFATAVYASCTSTTIVGPRGDVTICQTCCYQGQCTTVCY
jgi:hypothetical protein